MDKIANQEAGNKPFTPDIMMGEMMQRLVELVIVMVCILTPQFLMAAELDGDEFAKAVTGTALAGVVLGAYKVYKDGVPSLSRRDQDA